MNINDLSIHDLIISYYDSLKIANYYVNHEVIGILKALINPSLHESAVLGSFYRIHSLATSLTRLNQKIDANAVAIISRTLYEIRLDLIFFLKNDLKSKDLEKYFQFPKISRYKKAYQLQELQKNFPQISDSTLLPNSFRETFLGNSELDKDIIPAVKRIWGSTNKGKPNWPQQWHGQTIFSFASQFGPIFEQEYLEIYTILSSFTHSGCGAYLNFDESTFESTLGVLVEYSRNIYLEAIFKCVKFFQIDKGNIDFDVSFDSLKKFPVERLVEYIKNKNINIS